MPKKVTSPANAPNWRNLVAFGHDLAVTSASWLLGYLLRFNFSIPSEQLPGLQASLVWLIAIQAALFVLSGMYRGLWRYASLVDLRKIVMTAVTGTLCLGLAILVFRIPGVPRSVLLSYPFFLVALMGGSRIAYRIWKEQSFVGFSSLSATPVMIVGANDLSERLIRELRAHGTWRVIGVVDIGYEKHGRHLHGIKVVGGLDKIAQIAQQHALRHAIVALPYASAAARRRAVRVCTGAGLEVLTVPSATDVLQGKVTVSQLRHVEVDDLLGREAVSLDTTLISGEIQGKCVFVTGAGGSIGSELCRQIVRFRPRLLVMFEASEHALYQIEQELRRLHPDAALLPLIGDVKDANRLDQVFRQHPFDMIFHAAAYKHVPLMEEQNAWQAVRNNVLGTAVLAKTADRHGVPRFVLISTDKAVNPTSVMGATKRLAEIVCQSERQQSRTLFIVVRFGNVLGSTGSVIPKFREQIARGGPITVTHPEMTRYFMSIPEAAQLVLQAGAMGNGGEIFVLDMGEPVRILDLARDMIRLTGLEEKDIAIEFTGLRPGEKLYEELLADEETTLPTPHAKLRIAKSRPASRETMARLQAWIEGDVPQSDSSVQETLKELIPEYRGSLKTGEGSAPNSGEDNSGLRLAANG